MATSGTAVFNQTRNQIIRRAARRVGALRGSGEIMSQAMELDFAGALNAMVKQWQAEDGLHVWTVTEGVLFPQVGQTRYALASGGADHATLTYTGTTTTAAASAGATSITVDSITSIADNDHLGIVLDDGTLFWTTVNGAPVGSTVAFDNALTGAVASGNRVYAYTNKLVRPLRIVQARRYGVSDEADADVSVIARLEYQLLPNKAQRGIINQVFYDPQLGTGYLHLYNTPSSVGDLLKFTHWRPIEDFNASGDNPDLPPEWINTLAHNLAVEMAPEYSVPPQQFQTLKITADESKAAMKGWDREAESVQFGVDMQDYQ